MTTLFDTDKPLTRAGITPRPYQVEAHDGSFVAWDKGILGALVRIFTGGGKTLISCLAADTWLRRSSDHRVMIVSYERQLVNQFAEEVYDYLGIEPGIEMESQEATAADRIVVASRQTILTAKPPTKTQATELLSYNIKPLDVYSGKLAEKYLKHLRKGGDRDMVIDDLIDKARDPLVVNGVRSRLHKFDWKLPWMVIFDEAHKHAYSLPSVTYIVDWFEQNPDHRRLGPTATPKITRGVSLGDKMFPAIAIDYPLYSSLRPCAVKDGWAVPYVQRYIEVQGVDFKNPKILDKGSESGFDDAALAKMLETQLATFVCPMLDMVGDRKTLIFSGSRDMAAHVARFINARTQTKCECGIVKWHPTALLGETVCECGKPVVAAKTGEQARSLDGEVCPSERKLIYQGHQRGDFQFLSVCGLCREGYNDPDISCIAVFRPVSKKASALAEQMKGRGCRVLRALAKLLHTMADATARCKAIAESAKPNCLIVDLVGITGLADCASTVEIYAEGLPDEIKERAAEILEEAPQEMDVDAAIEQANREAEETREKIRKEREEAELKAIEEAKRRAEARPEVKYTSQEVGYGRQGNPDLMSEGQEKYIRNLGMEFDCVDIGRKRAGRIIGMLKQRKPFADVARENGISDEHWRHVPPTDKSMGWLKWKRINPEGVRCQCDFQTIRQAFDCPEKFIESERLRISGARDAEELTAIAKSIALAKRVLSPENYGKLLSAGQAKRGSFAAERPIDDDPE